MSDSNNNLSFEEELRQIDERLSKEEKQAKAQSSSIRFEDDRHYSSSSRSKNTSHKSSSSSNKNKRKPDKPSKKARKRKANKRHGFRNTILIIVLVLALAIGGAYYYLNSELSKINRNESIDNSDYTASEIDDSLDTEDKYDIGSTENIDLISDKNVKNILLLGQDRTSGDKKYQRSDVIMLCSINTKTNEISLTSIMRDLYVPIYVSDTTNMYGPINYSLLRGGPKCTCKTIESDFGIKIDGYMLVDFYQFVDALSELGDGTLDIELTQEEATYLNENHNWVVTQLNKEQEDWNLVEGTNKMTALQVLGYCRIRKIDNDFHRVGRQQTAIQAVFNKLRSESITEIIQFIDNVLPNMYTDLSNKDIIKYAYTIFGSKMSITGSYRIPIDGAYEQEVVNDENYANGSDLHLIIPDLEKNAEALQEYIYDYK